MTPGSSTSPVEVSFLGLLAAVLHVDDPRERLRRLAVVDDGVDELKARTRRLRRQALLEVRRTDPRVTWAELGADLGVTGARAEQMSREDD